MTAADRHPRPAPYTLAQDNGWWWLVTPEGRRLFSIGVNHVNALARPGATRRVVPARGCPEDRLWDRVAEHLAGLACNTLGYDAPDALRQTLPTSPTRPSTTRCTAPAARPSPTPTCSNPTE